MNIVIKTYIIYFFQSLVTSLPAMCVFKLLYVIMNNNFNIEPAVTIKENKVGLLELSVSNILSFGVVISSLWESQ